VSIYKRKSGKWAVLVDMDTTSAGVRRRRSLGTYPTRKGAERAEREALTMRDRGVDLAPQTVTVSSAMERYLRDRETRCGAKTLQEYANLSARYIVPRLGSVLLAKLRPAHVSEWQAFLASEGGQNGRPISPKTVYHARSLLFGMMRWAVKMQLVAQNVVANVDAPRVRRSDAKALDDSEVARILETANTTRWGPFVALAISLGTRRGELMALRWSDIDVERRTVKIARSLSQTKAGGVAEKSTKTDRSRTVSLSPLALESLRRQRVIQAQDKLAAGGHYEDAGLVFANELGSRITPMAATNAYARLARKAGISSTRLHDVRHTAATALLLAGVDAVSVAGMLGHSSAVTTMTIYAHLRESAMVNAADVLGAAIERAVAAGGGIARQPNGNRGWD